MSDSTIISIKEDSDGYTLLKQVGLHGRFIDKLTIKDIVTIKNESSKILENHLLDTFSSISK